MNPRIALICRNFASQTGGIYQGGAERVMLQLGIYLQTRGFDPVVLQIGDAKESMVVSGLQVETVTSRFLTRPIALTRLAYRLGSVALLYEDLSMVPIGRLRLPAIGLNHGIFWDYPSKQVAHNPAVTKRYPTKVLLTLISFWRRKARHREILGLRNLDLVLTFDTGLLRLVQSNYPDLRDRIRTIRLFSDLPSIQTDMSPHLIDRSNNRPGSGLQQQLGRPIQILVPRNMTLSSGAAWLEQIASLLEQRIPDREWTIAVAGHVRPNGLGGARITMPSSTDRLFFLGSLDRPDLALELSKSEIVLIPTFAYEGACLAAIEALCAGKAIVATNIGGLNDTIIDGFTGLIAQPNPSDIADKVIELIQNEELRNELGREGARQSRLYTLSAWYDRLDKTLRPFLTTHVS
jgi:glycosyltransferase involved in cell wall biosynthesis